MYMFTKYMYFPFRKLWVFFALIMLLFYIVDERKLKKDKDTTEYIISHIEKKLRFAFKPKNKIVRVKVSLFLKVYKTWNIFMVCYWSSMLVLSFIFFLKLFRASTRIYISQTCALREYACVSSNKTNCIQDQCQVELIRNGTRPYEVKILQPALVLQLAVWVCHRVIAPNISIKYFTSDYTNSAFLLSIIDRDEPVNWSKAW